MEPHVDEIYMNNVSNIMSKHFREWPMEVVRRCVAIRSKVYFQLNIEEIYAKLPFVILYSSYQNNNLKGRVKKLILILQTDKK